jgi:hypothetical protein
MNDIRRASIFVFLLIIVVLFIGLAVKNDEVVALEESIIENTYVSSPSADTCPTGYYSTFNGTDFNCFEDLTGGTSTETDPQVNTLENNKWCASNGTVINCNVAPVVDTFNTTAQIRAAEIDTLHDSCSEISGCVVGAMSQATANASYVGLGKVFVNDDFTYFVAARDSFVGFLFDFFGSSVTNDSKFVI